MCTNVYEWFTMNGYEWVWMTRSSYELLWLTHNDLVWLASRDFHTRPDQMCSIFDSCFRLPYLMFETAQKCSNVLTCAQILSPNSSTVIDVADRTCQIQLNNIRMCLHSLKFSSSFSITVMTLKIEHAQSENTILKCNFASARQGSWEIIFFKAPFFWQIPRVNNKKSEGCFLTRGLKQTQTSFFKDPG